MSIVWRCLALHSPGAVHELLDEVGCPGRQVRLYVESFPHCALRLEVVHVFRLMFMGGPIRPLTDRPTIVEFRLVAWAPKSVVPWERGPAMCASAFHRTHSHLRSGEVLAEKCLKPKQLRRTNIGAIIVQDFRGKPPANLRISG